MKKIWNKIKEKWQMICIKDKMIIIIMAILMIQSVLNLFLNKINSVEAINIDVIFRTTTAAIFGYILSVNFLNSNNKVYPVDNENHEQTESIEKQLTQGETAIGLDGDKGGEGSIQKTKRQCRDPNGNTKLQIFIAGVICICSLIVLMIVRNFTEYDGNHSATITQFRDFISGCVGFLIGHSSMPPTKKNKK